MRANLRNQILIIETFFYIFDGIAQRPERQNHSLQVTSSNLVTVFRTFFKKKMALLSVCLCPLLTAFFLFFVKTSTSKIKQISFFSTVLVFLINLTIWFFQDNGSFAFQQIFYQTFNSTFSSFLLGIDTISLVFMILTTFSFPLCFLVSNSTYLRDTSDQVQIQYYCCSLLILESFILFVFCALDLVLFQIFFEAVLLPIFFILVSLVLENGKLELDSFFFFIQ